MVLLYFAKTPHYWPPKSANYHPNPQYFDSNRTFNYYSPVLFSTTITPNTTDRITSATTSAALSVQVVAGRGFLRPDADDTGCGSSGVFGFVSRYSFSATGDGFAKYLLRSALGFELNKGRGEKRTWGGCENRDAEGECDNGVEDANAGGVDARGDEA